MGGMAHVPSDDSPLEKQQPQSGVAIRNNIQWAGILQHPENRRGC
jgi:hypothetical protein